MIRAHLAATVSSNPRPRPHSHSHALTLPILQAAALTERHISAARAATTNAELAGLVTAMEEAEAAAREAELDIRSTRAMVLVSGFLPALTDHATRPRWTPVTVLDSNHNFPRVALIHIFTHAHPHIDTLESII